MHTHTYMYVRTDGHVNGSISVWFEFSRPKPYAFQSICQFEKFNAHSNHSEPCEIAFYSSHFIRGVLLLLPSLICWYCILLVFFAVVILKICTSSLHLTAIILLWNTLWKLKHIYRLHLYKWMCNSNSIRNTCNETAAKHADIFSSWYLIKNSSLFNLNAPMWAWISVYEILFLMFSRFFFYKYCL